jgi:hypothetical protein
MQIEPKATAEGVSAESDMTESEKIAASPDAAKRRRWPYVDAPWRPSPCARREPPDVGAVPAGEPQGPTPVTRGEAENAQ